MGLYIVAYLSISLTRVRVYHRFNSVMYVNIYIYNLPLCYKLKYNMYMGGFYHTISPLQIHLYPIIYPNNMYIHISQQLLLNIIPTGVYWELCQSYYLLGFRQFYYINLMFPPKKEKNHYISTSHYIPNSYIPKQFHDNHPKYIQIQINIISHCISQL